MKPCNRLMNGHGTTQRATRRSIRADERSAEELPHAIRQNSGRHP
jgi:hypothetical protein